MYYKKNGLKVMVSDLELAPTQEMSGRRRVYRLIIPLDVSITASGVQSGVSVPAGFTTDLATIPLVAQVFLGGRDAPGVAEAAVIHDWLCETNAPRSFANSCLFCLLLAFNVPRWKALCFYFAVSVFGYKSWLSVLKRKSVGAWRWMSNYMPLES
jgi:hypothetical protein